MKKIILLLTLFLCSNFIYSQPGQLDPFFGTNGIVRNSFGSKINESTQGRQVLLQADGSMYILTETKEQTLIAKRLKNGSPDSSYGKNGFSVSVPFAYAHAAMQPDGKIVVAGRCLNNNSSENFYDFGVARFNTNGSLDNTFNGSGKITTDYGYDDAANYIAIQSDGRVLIGGSTVSKGGEFSYGVLLLYNQNGSLEKTTIIGDFLANAIGIQKDGKIVTAGYKSFINDDGDYADSSALARYNADGSLDGTFCGDGIQSFNYEGNTSINFQTDGKLIITSHNTITRFNKDGSLDNTFSGDGKQLTSFPIASLAIQTDGKLVAAGGTNNDFSVARYNTNGSLDITFSGDGKLTTAFSGTDFANSVVIQTDGKIVAVGNTSAGTNSKFAVARYNINGTLDNTLSGDGTLTDQIHQQNTVYLSTAVQSDGKIVAGGNGILVRYLSTGILDKTFSGDGIQTTGFTVASVAIQTDGKIVAAGDSVLARYNSNGTLDNTFSADGKQKVGFRINSLVLQLNDKAVVGGSSLARYKIDGTLDFSFAGDGAIRTPLVCNDLAIQADGKVVAVGSLYGNFAIARYYTNGYPDNTFGENGLKTNPVEDYTEGYSKVFYAQSVAIQSDGKIITAGYSLINYREINSYFVLSRHNSDGSLDSSFAENGIQEIYFRNDGRASSVAIQSDGKILVAGYGWSGSNKNFALARLNNNGNPDNSFGSGGVQVTPVSGADNEIQSIAIANNKLYTVGYAQYPNNVGVVARYLLAANKPPTVSITSPVNNAVYYAPATINISATASDADGKISNVKFYNGTTLLKTEYYYPYTCALSNVAPGTYSLTAKATDNFGLVTTSAVVKVTVMSNKAPVVSLTRPANNAIYYAPATINMSALAADADGNISNVKFYNGTTLLRTENYYPYTYAWSNVAAGTYSITAKATDNHGLTTTSAAVHITVKAPNTTIVSNKPSSINDQTNANGSLSLKLSPNPATDILHVSSTGIQQNKPATISVISASGVVMKTIQSNISNKVVQLDVSSMVSGVYTIKVVSGYKAMYKQFVKL